MSDNKKYYYLKLKDNFFDSSEVIALESLPDGMMYVNILLKLYLRSLNRGGCLMLTDRIPYNTSVLAKVVRHPEGVVKEALKIFQELGMVDILETGEMYMLDIQNFIGESSTEADRKRDYRNRIEESKNGQMVGQMSSQKSRQISTIIRDRDKDRDRDRVELFENAKCNSQNCKMENTKSPNGVYETAKPIPNINTNINTKKEYAVFIHMTEENYNKLLAMAQGNKDYLADVIYDCNEWRKDHPPKGKNPNDYLFVKNWLKKELAKSPVQQVKPPVKQEANPSLEDIVNSLPEAYRGNLDQFR